MTQSNLSKLLYEIGLHLDRVDVSYCFHVFNTRRDGYISREEFSIGMGLRDHELDIITDQIRSRLIASATSSAVKDQSSAALTGAGASVAAGGPSSATNAAKASRDKSRIRENRMLSQIFKLINVNGDHILGVHEFINMVAKLEIFMTEEEVRKIMKAMDLDHDDRVEEVRTSGCMQACVQRAYITISWH
jgi:uncharacterized protein YeeX (DUF496 family)